MVGRMWLLDPSTAVGRHMPAKIRRQPAPLADQLDRVIVARVRRSVLSSPPRLGDAGPREAVESIRADVRRLADELEAMLDVVSGVTAPSSSSRPRRNAAPTRR